MDKAWTGVLAVLSLVIGGVGCVHTEPGGTDGEAEEWEVHTAQRPGFTYRIEYPAAWEVEEGAATHFRAPTPLRGAVSVVVINEAETPPLPVDVTYSTVRLIELADRVIPVERRTPAAATERYVVRFRFPPYTVELRAVLDPTEPPDRAYEAVFDRMATTLSFSPNP